MLMTNSADALAVFESKRKPCEAGPHVRKLERNTYLEWLDDDLLLLRLHQTYIARFHPDRVSFDFDGWRTKVTFERAERFTPLRTLASNGLHFVVPNGISWSEARERANVLFTDGMAIHCDGTVTGAPLPTAHERIVDTVTTFPKRLRRWCARCVRTWDRFDWDKPEPEAEDIVMCMDCTRDMMTGDAGFYAHALKHLDEWSGTPIPVPNLDSWMERATPSLRLEGDELCTALTTKLYRTVRDQMVRMRLYAIDPNFVWLPPGKSSHHRVGRTWHDPFQ